MMWDSASAAHWKKALGRIPSEAEKFINSVVGRVFLGIRATETVTQVGLIRLAEPIVLC